MTEDLRIAAVDLNGLARGKRLPSTMLDKAMGGGVRMPLSALNVDIAGSDIDGSPLVFDTGDRDGVLVPWYGEPRPMPWLAAGGQLLPATMTLDDGTPFAGDPRAALQGVLERYAARGWTPFVAMELEFYLLDPGGGLEPPLNPVTGRRLDGSEILSLRETDGFEGFFDQLRGAARAMGLAAPVITCEAGVGQFELSLPHAPALEAADAAWLTKTLVTELAPRQDLAATFLAKPFGGEPGNGLHLHVSVVDKSGQNVFAAANDTLMSAIAGALAWMPASSLVLAPHPDSYARFEHESHAPLAANWGHENRTVAVRIPHAPPQACRLEHRVAGGDSNPYLVAAVILAAMLAGIESGAKPPPETTGNGYDGATSAMATDMVAAIDAARALETLLPPLLVDNLIRTKTQEWARFGELTPSERLPLYLERL